jgi:hypothetical protein
VVRARAGRHPIIAAILDRDLPSPQGSILVACLNHEVPAEAPEPVLADLLGVGWEGFLSDSQFLRLPRLIRGMCGRGMLRRVGGRLMAVAPGEWFARRPRPVRLRRVVAL